MNPRKLPLALFAVTLGSGCAQAADAPQFVQEPPTTANPAAGSGSAAQEVAEPDGSGSAVPDALPLVGPQRLLPAVENGMRVAARVEVRRESSLRVVRGQSAMTSSAGETISSSLVIHIIDGSKWGVEIFEVSFDSLSVDDGAMPTVTLGPSGPRAGETWTCRATGGSFGCIDNATSSERSLPPWVPITLVGLMPGAPVEVGESWTRASIDGLFALPGRADLDAALMLRGRAAGDNALEIAFELDGTAEDTAYGRTVPLRVVGSGHIRFVPEVEEVTEFAWTWTGDGAVTERIGGVDARCERTRSMSVDAALLRL